MGVRDDDLFRAIRGDLLGKLYMQIMVHFCDILISSLFADTLEHAHIFYTDQPFTKVGLNGYLGCYTRQGIILSLSVLWVLTDLNPRCVISRHYITCILHHHPPKFIVRLKLSLSHNTTSQLPYNTSLSLNPNFPTPYHSNNDGHHN